MSDATAHTSDTALLEAKSPSVPLGLRAFAYALLGPACAINAALVALAVPAMAPFGIAGLLAAGAIGAVLGVFPARWLARRIHDQLQA